MIKEHYRRQRRFGWLPLDALRERLSLVPPPEEAVMQSELQTSVLQAVARLDEREREIVALKFGGNLKNVQIAGLTGLTASNVGVILYRTMKQLRIALEQEGMRK